MTAAPLEYHPSSPAAGGMILLHGLGADGGDLFPLAEQLAGGRLRVVCPHAPTRPVTLNGGMRMPAWYDIVGVNLKDRQDEEGIARSAKEIEQLLAAEKSRGLAAKQLFLAGFSQGAAMALYTGVRHSEPLGGIIALSGYLPLAEKTAREAACHRRTPIFMAHGAADDIVRPEWAKQSDEVLRQLGWTTEYHEYDAAHFICPREIDDLNRWLEARLLSPE